MSTFTTELHTTRLAALRALADIIATSDDKTEVRHAATAVLRISTEDPEWGATGGLPASAGRTAHANEPPVPARGRATPPPRGAHTEIPPLDELLQMFDPRTAHIMHDLLSPDPPKKPPASLADAAGQPAPVQPRSPP